MHFKEAPTLARAVEILEGCEWSDPLIELRLWTKLAYLAYNGKAHKIVVQCALKALEFAGTHSADKALAKSEHRHKYVVEQEMLSYSCCLYGQSLIDNTQGSLAIILYFHETLIRLNSVLSYELWAVFMSPEIIYRFVVMDN